jgi:hypothetical protein
MTEKNVFLLFNGEINNVHCEALMKVTVPEKLAFFFKEFVS